jgi:hypothetical protein
MTPLWTEGVGCFGVMNKDWLNRQEIEVVRLLRWRWQSPIMRMIQRPMMKPNQENAPEADNEAQSRECSKAQWWSPIMRILRRWDEAQSWECSEGRWWSPISGMLRRSMRKPNHENTLKADDEAQSQEYSKGWGWSLIPRILWRPMTKPNHKNTPKAQMVFLAKMKVFLAEWWRCFFDQRCKKKSMGIFLYKGVRKPTKLFFVWRYKKTNNGTRKPMKVLVVLRFMFLCFSMKVNCLGD